MSKITIDIHIPFYNYKGSKQRTAITRKNFSHWRNVRKEFEEKAEITFTVVGSELDDSRNLSNEYFLENEYYEFDQEDKKYSNFADMFGAKCNFGIRMALQKNTDIFFTSSSNDLIPFEFFEQIIYFFNSEYPQVYGISNYYNGKNSSYLIPYDNEKNIFKNEEGLWWDGIYKNKEVEFSNYIAGIMGYNNKLIRENSQIIENFGWSEIENEKITETIPNLQKFHSKDILYFNIKTISGDEITTLHRLKNFGLKFLDYESSFSDKIKEDVSKFKEYFLKL